MNNQALRRKLLYQSLHRGCKELDIIIGGFAQQYLSELTEVELTNYARILAADDVLIYSWITNEAPIPKEFDTITMEKLLSFCQNMKIKV